METGSTSQRKTKRSALTSNVRSKPPLDYDTNPKNWKMTMLTRPLLLLSLAFLFCVPAHAQQDPPPVPESTARVAMAEFASLFKVRDTLSGEEADRFKRLGHEVAKDIRAAEHLQYLGRFTLGWYVYARARADGALHEVRLHVVTNPNTPLGASEKNTPREAPEPAARRSWGQ